MSYNGSGQGVSWYLLLANVQRGSGELSSPLSDGALVSTAHQYQTGALASAAHQCRTDLAEADKTVGK